MNNNKIKSDIELSKELYHVAREKGTEAPFSGKYLNEHSKGMYTCINVQSVEQSCFRRMLSSIPVRGGQVLLNRPTWSTLNFSKTMVTVCIVRKLFVKTVVHI